MVEDYVALLSTIATVGTGLGVIATLFWRGLTWLNKKQDEKAVILKKQTEQYADNLKKQTEDAAAGLKINHELIASSLAKVATDTALTLKENNEKIAAGLKENNERIASSLARVATDTALTLKENNAGTNELITTKLNESTDKLNLVLKGLGERADLTNGNVAAIRTDIQDLQEDMYELYSSDDIDYQKSENGRDVEVDRGHGRDSLSARKNRRRLDTSRRRTDRNKRRGIESDRQTQHEKRDR